MRLKFAEEICAMTMKNDAKFEEKLICRFKIDIRILTNFDTKIDTSNLTNFDPSTQKSQKFTL